MRLEIPIKHSDGRICIGTGWPVWQIAKWRMEGLEWQVADTLEDAQARASKEGGAYGILASNRYTSHGGFEWSIDLVLPATEPK